MIWEGRQAKGFLKRSLRRRLSKEMGEDFKMYTGLNLGEQQEEGDAEESRGIRGELNNLIKNIYLKIAPTKPITSPIQEDLTILTHPLGGLEVAFNVSCFYADLTKKYASLAGDRRKVLKSVLDEEVLKWIWRWFYSIGMGDPRKLPTFSERIPSTGARFVPNDKQQFSSPQKIVDIGEFLLSTTMAGSHLRFPLCFYFANLVRQIQYRLLPTQSRSALENAFDKARAHKHGEPVDDVLVAADFLMNTKGNSQQAFDDVLAKEEQDALNYIPVPEIAYLERFREFSNKSFKASMAKFIPQVSKEEIMEGEGVSLMPIMMLLRTQPTTVCQGIMERIPGPFLNLMKNRLGHGTVDDVSKSMLDRIEEMVKRRREKGEQYTVYGRQKGAPTVQTTGKAAPKAVVHPGASGGPRAGGGVGGAVAGQAAAARPAGPSIDFAGALNERLIIGWDGSGTSLRVTSVAPKEVIGLMGTDVRALLPWVVYALRTGQVFRLPSDQVNKDTVEKILRGLLQAAGGKKAAQLSDAELQRFHQQSKGLPPNKFLATMAENYDIGAAEVERAGALSGSIDALCDKVGEQLEAFLKNPNQEEFRPVLQDLSSSEKSAVSVLNRVAKTQ